MQNNILIIAGEPSGDMRAGELLKELKSLRTDVSFWGIGGDIMAAEGVQLTEHIKNLSIVGIWEVVCSLAKIRRQYKDIAAQIRKRKPSAAILVDYPGFNLKVAKLLHSEGIPVLYYIIPQVWAWGAGRIKKIKQYTNKTLVLFDFEEALLLKSGIDCKFTGHPLVDKISRFNSIHKENKCDPADPNLTIALLPGSRKSEIQTLLPLMLGAAKQINDDRKNVRFFIAENSNIDKAIYESIIESYKSLPLTRIVDDTLEVLRKSDFSIVASGTATLETAVMGKPMIITYRVSPITAFIGRRFMTVSFLSLVNIIANKEIVPELLQENATPEKLAKETLAILDDKQILSKMCNDLQKVKQALGNVGASKRAAQAVSEFLSNNS